MVSYWPIGQSSRCVTYVSKNILAPMLRFLFLLLIPTLALHAQTAAVSGVVLEEENGEVIIGATIRIVGDSTGATRGTVRGGSTNKFGYYAITGLMPGRYSMSVRSVGYSTVTRA